MIGRKLLQRSRRDQRGFTFLELVVAIGITLILLPVTGAMIVAAVISQEASEGLMDASVAAVHVRKGITEDIGSASSIKLVSKNELYIRKGANCIAWVYDEDPTGQGRLLRYGSTTGPIPSNLDAAGWTVISEEATPALAVKYTKVAFAKAGDDISYGFILGSDEDAQLEIAGTRAPKVELSGPLSCWEDTP